MKNILRSIAVVTFCVGIFGFLAMANPTHVEAKKETTQEQTTSKKEKVVQEEKKIVQEEKKAEKKVMKEEKQVTKEVQKTEKATAKLAKKEEKRARWEAKKEERAAAREERIAAKYGKKTALMTRHFTKKLEGMEQRANVDVLLKVYPLFMAKLDRFIEKTKSNTTVDPTLQQARIDFLLATKETIAEELAALQTTVDGIDGTGTVLTGSIIDTDTTGSVEEENSTDD